MKANNDRTREYAPRVQSTTESPNESTGADYTPRLSAQDINRQRQYADDAVAGGGGVIGPTGVHAVACPGWSP